MLDDYDQKWKHTSAQFELTASSLVHNPTDDGMVAGPVIYDNYKQVPGQYLRRDECLKERLRAARS